MTAAVVKAVITNNLNYVLYILIRPVTETTKHYAHYHSTEHT